VAVETGVLAAACDALNAPWLRFIRSGRPFVTLKVAATLDGKIATVTGDSRWVTGPEARAWVHRLRDRVDAVLIGSGTARADDPRLTARLPGGRGRDPLRVVLDTDLGLPSRLRLFHLASPAPTVVAHASRRTRRFGPGVETLACRPGPGGVDLADLLAKLAARGVTHLLVEGGAAVNAAFLGAGLVDRLALLLAPRLVGARGLSWLAGPGAARMAETPRLEGVEVEPIGPDLLVTATPSALAKKARRD
jgi:diaminohydroxyphosphoribosylaminopyrimidine deaminase/5-amino-6-(5-phosphoribosylamino)uracil reductase